jgi:putative ABC transport system substrate-binding protein
MAALGASAAGLVVAGCSVPFLQGNRTRLPRIGFLSSEFPDAGWHGALWESLRTLGWIEGENFVVDRRYAEDHSERFASLADELVRVPVDVIMTEGTPMGLVAQQATTTIPIVVTSGDPVGVGLVASLARPGGNITGISTFGTRSPQGPSKTLELLKGVVPALTRVGVLFSDYADLRIMPTWARARDRLGIRLSA